MNSPASSNDADARFDRIVVDLHLKGRVDEARDAYRQLLETAPGHAGAIANLGQILRRQGEQEEALRLYRRAAALPDVTAEILFNLANAEDDAGDAEAALAVLDRAQTLKPEMVPALHKRGLILSRLKRWEEAVDALRAAARIAPEDRVIRCDLGVALNHDGAPELAEPLFRWAIADQPEAARPRRLLADLLSRSRRLDEAETLYRALLKNGGKEEERAALALAELLVRRSRLEEAVDLLRTRHAAEPDNANVAIALAGSLLKVHQIVEAVRICRRLLVNNPEHPSAHYFLASAYTLLHHNAEAQNHGLHAIEAGEDVLPAISNHLFSSLNSDDLTAEEIAQKHRDMAARLPAPDGVRPPRRPRRPGTPLRIGFYTADLFGLHPVAQFFEPVLANLDRDRFQPVIYSRTGELDPTTERFQRLPAAWRDIGNRTDAHIAELLRGDELDILVDLAGHTADNGLRFFSRRMAPVQISYIGYPHSTGLREMDYIISDSVVTPPELEHLYSETVLRPNPCLWVFQPPPENVIVNRPRNPARPPGAITFGSLNTTSKLSDRCLSLWARILTRCPQATLLLKAGGFAEAATVDSFRQRLAAHGADTSRVVFEPPEPFSHALGVYNVIDVMLDAMPFNGGTTTCQALWMGTPVLTRQGEAMCQRLSSSFLTAVGLKELITTSDEAYVELACALAHDAERVANLRNGLRRKVLASPLCDASTYTKNLQAAFEELVVGSNTRERVTGPLSM